MAIEIYKILNEKGLDYVSYVFSTSNIPHELGYDNINPSTSANIYFRNKITLVPIYVAVYRIISKTLDFV